MSDVAELVDRNYKLDRLMIADPICGYDFCDWCGDCLACDRDDECYGAGSPMGVHSWCIYADRVDIWLEHHPEAKPIGDTHG